MDGFDFKGCNSNFSSPHCGSDRLSSSWYRASDICQKLFKALCEIEWVIKFQLSTKEVNHIDEVINNAVASCTTFSQLNLTIDAFKIAVSHA